MDDPWRAFGRPSSHLVVALLTCAAAIGPSLEGAQIRGKVRDENGVALSGVSITVLGGEIARACPDVRVGSRTNLGTLESALPIPDESLASGTSSTDGSFTVALPASVSSPFVLLASKQGFAPRLTQTHEEEVDLTLRHGIDLAVYLEDRDHRAIDGRLRIIPLATCYAALDAFRGSLIRDTATDDDGIGVFQDLSPGSYALRIEADGFQTVEIPALLADRHHETYILALPRGRSLRGRLLLSEEMTFADARVIAVWGESTGPNEHGTRHVIPATPTFELQGLPRAGRIQVQACVREHCSSVRTIDSAAISDDDLGELVVPSPLDWVGEVYGKFSGNQLIVYAHPAHSALVGRIRGLQLAVFEAKRVLVEHVPTVIERLEFLGMDRGYGTASLADRDAGSLGSVRILEATTLRGRFDMGEWVLINSVVELRSQGQTFPSRTLDSSGRFAFSIPPTPSAAAPVVLRLPESAARVSSNSTSQWPIYDALHTTDLPVHVGTRDGRPVRGFSLEVAANDHAPMHLTAHTDDGTVYLRQPMGEQVRIAVSRFNAHETAQSTVLLPEAERAPRASFVLREVPSVYGTVQTSDSSALADVRVELQRHEGLHPASIVSEARFTAEDGAWTFHDVTPGSYVLRASADGFTSTTTRILVDDTIGSRPIGIVLETPGEITGRITGLRADETAVVRLTNTTLTGDRRSQAIDELAAFRFAELPAGRYRLSLGVRRAETGSESLVDRDVSVVPGGRHFVEFRLEDTIRISGRATLGETRLDCADLVFEQHGEVGEEEVRFRTTLTDRAGNYAVMLDEGGKYEVRVATEAVRPGLAGPTKLLVDITDDPVQEIDLHFSNSSIRGSVVNRSEQALGGASVTLWQVVSHDAPTPEGGARGLSLVNEVTTASDGSFELNAVEKGEYRIEVRATDHAVFMSDVFSLAEDEEKVLPPIILAPGRSMTVSAVGPSGTPISGAVVAAFANGNIDGIGSPPYAITQADGSATLDDLALGAYTLVGLFPGTAPSIVHGAQVGGEPAEVELRFTSGGTLEIHILTAEGEPKRGIRPRLRDESGRDVTRVFENLAAMSGSSFTSGDSGYLRIDTIAPGHYTVAVRGSEGVSTYIKEGLSSAVTVHVK